MLHINRVQLLPKFRASHPTFLLFTYLALLSLALTQTTKKVKLQPDDTKEIKSCLSEELELEERSTCRFFAAVIDAGSTGTRLHLFEFSHDIASEHSNFKLESEVFKEVKPGLSSFASTPELAAESVRELLFTAKKVIPESLWVHTPIVLKATAGLRLLPEEEADAILSEVETEVSNSGLMMDDTGESVGMLSGTDEGVFGWFTLNYLLERLGYGEAFSSDSETAAALDLGGGSTQITFVPSDFDVALHALPKDTYSHQLNLFGRQVKLYTHSYLGNGLVAARIGIARLSPESVPATHSLYTSCFPQGFTLKDWDYAGNAWTVRPTKTSDFSSCLASTREYVEQVTSVVEVPQLIDRDVYMFGYFYDRGYQAGFVGDDPEHLGGPTTVGDYKLAAERACAIPAEDIGPEHWRPWQCMDLTYIYTLLHYGYGLPDRKQIYLAKKLKEKEVSWALGAGFHLLNTYHSERIMKAKAVRSVSNSREETANKNVQFETQQRSAGLNSTANQPTTFFGQLIDYISDAATHIMVYLNLAS
ncbi:GDA1/CD39 (nucleoside phosphatase) family domain-containing protein [Ditylenchus destructor]|nr:GDA1/CD39 (nucleoside phosphatase) family domain-containing protein [Ditylenchus destructor]